MASNTGGQQKSKYVAIVATIPFDLARAVRQPACSENTKSMFTSKTMLAIVRAVEDLSGEGSDEEQSSKFSNTVDPGKVNITVMVPRDVARIGEDNPDRECDEVHQTIEDFALSKIEEIIKTIKYMPFTDFDISPPVLVQTPCSKVFRPEHTLNGTRVALRYSFGGEIKPVTFAGEKTVHSLAVALAKLEDIPLHEQRLSFEGLYIAVGNCQGVHPGTSLDPLGIGRGSPVDLSRRAGYNHRGSSTVHITVTLLDKISGSPLKPLDFEVNLTDSVRTVLTDLRFKRGRDVFYEKMEYNGYELPLGLTMDQFGVTTLSNPKVIVQ